MVDFRLFSQLCLVMIEAQHIKYLQDLEEIFRLFTKHQFLKDNVLLSVLILIKIILSMFLKIL